MKKIAFFLMLLYSPAMFAQGSQLPKYTVATLPSAASVPTYMVQVIDAASPSTCTVGGGSYNVICTPTGGVWMPASMVYPGAGVPVSTGSAWSTSKPLAGAGAGVTTGPTTTAASDCASFSGTGGQLQDSGSPCTPFPAIDPKQNGAYVDGQEFTDATVTSGSSTITFASYEVPASCVSVPACTVVVPYGGSNLPRYGFTGGSVSGTTFTFTGNFPTSLTSVTLTLSGFSGGGSALNTLTCSSIAITGGGSGGSCTLSSAPGTIASSGTGIGTSGTAAAFNGSFVGTVATVSGCNGGTPNLCNTITVTGITDTTPQLSISGPRTIIDMTTVGNSYTLTDPAATFLQGDVGKKITVPYIGPSQIGSVPNSGIGYGPLTVEIESVPSSSTVTVSASALYTLNSNITVTAWNITSSILCFTNSGNNRLVAGMVLYGYAGFSGPDSTVLASIPAAFGSATINSSGLSTTTFCVNASHVNYTGAGGGTINLFAVNVPGALVMVGHNDLTAWQTMETTAASTGKEILLDPGSMLLVSTTTTPTPATSNVSIVGQGLTSKILVGGIGVYPGWAFWGGNGTITAPISNVLMDNFELDMVGATFPFYAVGQKCFFSQYTSNFRILRLYAHDSGATCLGNDFNVAGVEAWNRVEYAGSAAQKFSGNGGGSCIGNGTGMAGARESLDIYGNTVSMCGIHGIFCENQGTIFLPSGSCNVHNNTVRYGAPNLSNASGIGDHGDYGMHIADNDVYGYNYGITTHYGFNPGPCSTSYEIHHNVLWGNGVGWYNDCPDGSGDFSDNDIGGWGANASGLLFSSICAQIIPYDVVSTTSTPTIRIMNDFCHETNGPAWRMQNNSTNTLPIIEFINTRTWNIGTSATPRPAYEVLGAVTAIAGLRFEGATSAYDNRGGSSGLSYGISIPSGATVSNLYIGPDTDFSTAISGPVSNAGTVTAWSWGLGSSYYPTFQYNTGATTAPVQNQATTWAFDSQVPFVANYVNLRVVTADNTANLYSFAVYGKAGNLIAKLNATAGTTFAPSAALTNLALTTTGTVPAGRFYVTMTTNCSSACATFAVNTGTTYLPLVGYNAGTTSGAVPLASITPPADTFSNTAAPWFELHQ